MGISLGVFARNTLIEFFTCRFPVVGFQKWDRFWRWCVLLIDFVSVRGVLKLMLLHGFVLRLGTMLRFCMAHLIMSDVRDRIGIVRRLSGSVRKTSRTRCIRRLKHPKLIRGYSTHPGTNTISFLMGAILNTRVMLALTNLVAFLVFFINLVLQCQYSC